MMAPMAASLIASMVSSLIEPVASSLINAITGKGVMRAGKRQEGGILLLLALLLMMKLRGYNNRKGYNNMNHMDKNLYFHSIL